MQYIDPKKLLDGVFESDEEIEDWPLGLFLILTSCVIGAFLGLIIDDVFAQEVEKKIVEECFVEGSNEPVTYLSLKVDTSRCDGLLYTFEQDITLERNSIKNFYRALSARAAYIEGSL